MIEETTASPVQETPVQTQGSVFDKYASKITASREAAKKVEPVTETPVAEVPTEEVTQEVTVETPKEQPLANGKSHAPEKDVEITKETVIAEPETDWRKELGFEDGATHQEPVVGEKDDAKVIKAYEEKLKEYEKLKEDPFIAAYKAAKEAGKDVSSFISEIKGQDVNAMAPEQLWEVALKAEGLTTEEIATEMENFTALSPFEKRQKTKTVKQELISQQSEQLKKYADTTSQDATKQAEQAKQLAIMADQQRKQFFTKIKDKEWQGIKMTPSEAQKLENFLENDFKFQNADGTINYELYAKVGNYALNERTILQNTYKKGETRGYEKALLEFSRTNKNDTRFNSAPESKNKPKSELAKEAAKQAFGAHSN
jgi:hypothetical protein